MCLPFFFFPFNICSLQYVNTLTYLSSDAFSMIPPELIGDLQKMLSWEGASRPSASDFTGPRNEYYYLFFLFLECIFQLKYL